MYLKNVGSVLDVARDYAMAKYHKEREYKYWKDILDRELNNLGQSKKSPEAITAVTVQCLALIMSCK